MPTWELYYYTLPSTLEWSSIGSVAFIKWSKLPLLFYLVIFFFFTVMSGEDGVEFCLDPLSVLRHSLSSLECWLLKVHSGDPLWELPSAKAAVSKKSCLGGHLHLWLLSVTGKATTKSHFPCLLVKHLWRVLPAPELSGRWAESLW